MEVYPLNSLLEALNPHVTVFGDGTHAGGSLGMGLAPFLLRTDTRERGLSLSLCRVRRWPSINQEESPTQEPTM